MSQFITVGARVCALFMGICCFGCSAQAVNCSNLPAQFTGNEFPNGDFFSNFQNPCYMITLQPGGPANTDVNDTFWQIVYTVDPRYQLIVLGSFPNARYFSVTAYDDHSLVSQAILDTNIVPLTSSYVNPYQPGVPYLAGQQYAVPINFGGTPGALETGCMMNAYNVDVNALDATQRHQGINWNTDPAFFQLSPTPPVHNVDTPQHTNPTVTGYLLIRAYVDINTADPTTMPSIIVRDVASGCAYPAAYAQSVLQVINTTAGVNAALDQAQFQTHQSYFSTYLPSFCYGNDPRNALNWSRDYEDRSGPNPYGSLLFATLPSNLPATLAAAGEVLRFRLRLPVTPPTPCTNGCSRSGNEQMRYASISFSQSTGPTLASVGDFAFTQDANGYATLIVGTGASIPSWITPANGYTFLDLTAVPGFQNLQAVRLRNILTSGTFACSAQYVPYKTGAFGPDGSLMGDYLPVLDYPVAASLPPVASELVGPGACGVLPNGLPGIRAACGLLAANSAAISAVPAPAPGESPVAVQAFPPVTLTGVGFGLLPNGLPYTGNSNYLQITDFNQNWSAGYTGDPCSVSIGNWADNRIELVANVNNNGLCPLAVGDILGISVWNPQNMTSATTAAPVSGDVSYALGANSALVSSAAGSGTLELITTGPWTAISFTPWLHVSSLSASGVGSALIQFSYDANLNPSAQTGTLRIAGLTFTVTQVGTSFLPVTSAITLVSGLNNPEGVAVDAVGNVYVADTGNNAVEQWSAASGQVTPLVTSGLNSPAGVAVDALGNLYIADSGNHAVEQWTPAGQQVTPLVTGLNDPFGVGVDKLGNVYFSDAASAVIKEWNAVSQQATPLVGSGLTTPMGLAVDALGSIYVADSGSSAIQLWNSATGQLTALVSSGLIAPTGVAVDGQGNVYFTDTGNNAIKKWNPAAQQVVTLVSSGLRGPAGIAVDAQGNLYVADQYNNAIEKCTFAYLSLGATSLNEGFAAGADSVTVQVLPVNTPLTASSDQTWLTINNIAGGVINFTFQNNTLPVNRTAHITVLGQQVTVTQAGYIPASLTKSAGDGQSTLAGQMFPTALQVTVADSYGMPMQAVAVTFTVTPGPTGATGIWNLTPPMPLLTDQNGNAVAPGLTANNIAGQFTVTATVSGLSATFLLTNVVTTLGASSVLVSSAGGNGDVLLLASGPWTASSDASWLTLAPGSQAGTDSAVIQFNYAPNPNGSPQTGTLTLSGGLTLTVTQSGAGYMPISRLTTLISSGLLTLRGVAADGQGDVYIADSGNNVIKQWNAKTQQVTVLVPSGLNNPTGVAVDAAGNVYIADSKNNAIKMWSAATGQVTALVSSGLKLPVGVAVDSHGNVYFSDSGHNAIDEWIAASGAVTTLVSSGLNDPQGVAADLLGNVYFSDAKNNAVKEWNAVSRQVTSLVSSGLSNPYGVVVDGQGNVYIADSGNHAIKQWQAATQQVVAMVSTGLKASSGVAVDGQGNLYIAETNANLLKKLTVASLSLSTSSRSEGAKSGADSVTYQVLPTSTPVTATSNTKWLSVTSAANGVIGFSFKANTSTTSRTAIISVWGAQLTVTQSGHT